ncbi:unnamed protein product [Zymoseptoria tritici ST99CH_3D7]|uniref:Aminoglycoside phosphotransferase domain-containing protein n=1 Tax=Zymoseptoria tritici (strain ST99CH_3D7) TaxID=1276538 RepID=A0A1X7RUD4_ZYMT9|nr:unnamed protein product [Zymoseptoria tritici ST99CH_3D7]
MSTFRLSHPHANDIRTQTAAMANHSGYEARLAFVQTLLSDQLGLKMGLAQVTPLAYDPECPYTYNNFVYEIAIPRDCQFQSDPRSNESPPRIGFEPIPKGTSKLIMRLTNSSAMGIDPTYRVENEVAAMHLASAALSSLQHGRKVVPSVYGWASAAGGGSNGSESQGWTLQEALPGIELDAALPQLTLEQKAGIMAQLAEIIGALQKYNLPSTVTGFGGLSIVSSGPTTADTIVSGPSPLESAGPWDSYEAFFRQLLSKALASTDTNPHIDGWRGTELRAGLDIFLQDGIAALFRKLLSRDSRVLTHADLGAGGNLLVDVASGQITGVLDFDTAWVSHPSFEFLRSFYGLGGTFYGWEPKHSDERRALMEAKLHGFPSPLPASTETVDWDMAKAWEDALEKYDVQRPRTMAGFQGVADVDALVQMIAPWRLCNPEAVAGLSKDQIRDLKNECAQSLERMLSRLQSGAEMDYDN